MQFRDQKRDVEARYAYYRRCQVVRRNGEQCKAPAEKGSHICYAHAGQQAMKLRREQQRRTVLAEVAARMQRQGRADFREADLFLDFKGIQTAIVVMVQALSDGRIEDKTAGRLIIELQTASKLLWMMHRPYSSRKELPKKSCKFPQLSRSTAGEWFVCSFGFAQPGGCATRGRHRGKTAFFNSYC